MADNCKIADAMYKKATESSVCHHHVFKVLQSAKIKQCDMVLHLSFSHLVSSVTQCDRYFFSSKLLYSVALVVVA